MEHRVRKDYMELSVPGLSENESFCRVVVAAFASRLDPTVEEVNDIKTAVSEAVTNAIIHGYAGGEGEVKISAIIDGNTIIISVQDYGIGIKDLDKAREPLYTTCPDLERSGMGFTIMENFMDEMEVVSSPNTGTRVTMRKTIKTNTTFAQE